MPVPTALLVTHLGFDSDIILMYEFFDSILLLNSNYFENTNHELMEYDPSLLESTKD